MEGGRPGSRSNLVALPVRDARRTGLAAGAASLFLICGIDVEALAAMSFQGLGDLPGGPHSSIGIAVSGDGRTAIGLGDTDSREDFGDEAFVWTAAGGQHALGTGGFTRSYAWGVSRNGIIAGTLSGPSFSEAVRFDAMGGIERLGFLPGGGSSSSASDISVDGSVVVGTAIGPQGAQAMIHDDVNGMRGLGDLPGGIFSSAAAGVSDDGSIVVGSGRTSIGSEAFIWSESDGMRGLGSFASYSWSEAFDISADGTTVVGFARDLNFGGEEAFVWDAARGMRGIGRLSVRGRSSRALGVSGDGSVVVGTSITDGGSSKAFIHDEANGMRVLQDVLAMGGIDLSGWTLQAAVAVSDDGLTIVGSGIGPNGAEAWIATIPEPSVALFTGLGLAVLSGSRRSRQSVQ